MRMTKKITSIVLAVLMVVSMMSVMAISASALTAEDADFEYTNLAGTSVSYYNASGTMISGSGIYKLLRDATVNARMAPGIFASDVTIDLNGHVLTSTAEDFVFLVSRSGSATSPKKFKIMSSKSGGKVLTTNLAASTTTSVIGTSYTSTAKYNEITIASSATIESEATIVALFGDNNTLNVTGGTLKTTGNDFAIATNGAETHNATINISGGTITSTGAVAIYQPSDGTLNISGGTITGTTGVYVKSGTTNITGGTIKGTGAAADYDYYGSGANATGDAFVVDSCNYPGGAPVVSITGGTFNSTNAAAVSSYASQGDDPVEDFINAGTFKGAEAVDTDLLNPHVATGFNPSTGKVVNKELVATCSYDEVPDEDGCRFSNAKIILTDPDDPTYTEEYPIKPTISSIPADNTLRYRFYKWQYGKSWTVFVDVTGIKTGKEAEYAASAGGSWELLDDITLESIQLAGTKNIELDGNGYTITASSSADVPANRPLFRTLGNSNAITLTDVTLDGADYRETAVSSNAGGPSNTLTLTNVTIKNFVANADNMGVVQVQGSSTANITGCTFDNDDARYDVWGGAASSINIDGSDIDTVYLNGGTATAEIENGAIVGEIVAFEGNIITADSGDNITPPADYKVKDNGNGTYSVVPKVYVAQVGTDKYESLAAAISAAQNGGTVKLLADQTIDLQLAAGEEYTIDLNSYTLTVESPQNYYNYIYGDLTIDDSSAAKTGKVVVDDYGIAPRAGGKVTVNSGSFTTAVGYPYLIYLMGGELEVNGGTFTAVHPVNCYASGNTVLGGTVVINDGEFTSTEDYVISGFENSNITINGGSFTGPNPVFVGKASKKTSGFTPASATINAGTFTATNDTPVVGCAKGTSVTITGGTFTSGELSADSTSEISVSGGTFSEPVPADYCANGFQPKDNGNGTYGVQVKENPLDDFMISAADARALDSNLFELDNSTDYYVGTLLGVQKKEVAGTGTSAQETGQDMRFVAVLDTDTLKAADDYGFVLAKADSNKDYSDKIENIKYGTESAKSISAKGTYNNVCGDENYGDPSANTDYKYITCGVNNVNDGKKIVARFYVKLNGKYYYAKYAGHNYQYTGCMAAWSDLV